MPLIKFDPKSNMYPWCSHGHVHIAGRCPHECSYCFAQKYPATLSGKYLGPVRLIKAEIAEKYGKGKVIFIDYMNDLFSDGIDPAWIKAILTQCRVYPKNQYVFQTKNPKNAWEYSELFPPDYLIGTTIETNREYTDISKAPVPYDRATGIAFFHHTFVTVEPILDFDLVAMMDLIKMSHPAFVNIGADSKRGKLPEPSKGKVLELLAGLQKERIEVRKKTKDRKSVV